jgi:hypothetical protein
MSVQIRIESPVKRQRMEGGKDIEVIVAVRLSAGKRRPLPPVVTCNAPNAPFRFVRKLDSLVTHKWLYSGRVSRTGPLIIEAKIMRPEVAEASVEIMVVSDLTPPKLNIRDHPSEITGLTPPFRFNIEGTAEDVSGVKMVELKVNDKTFKPAKSAKSDWKEWTALVELDRVGENKILVRATDNEGNKKEVSTKVTTVIKRPQPECHYPALLLPVRLETRFMKKGNDHFLWVRIFPDDIHVTSHDPILTKSEYNAGLTYWERVNNVSDERDAWRELSHYFGPRRAAWIRRSTQGKPLVSNPNWPAPPLHDDTTEPHLRFPRLVAREFSSGLESTFLEHTLPDRFVVFLYDQNNRLIKKAEGKDIRSDLALFASSADQQSADDVATWLTDLQAAEKEGMAVKISLTDEQYENGISRLVVVGLKARDTHKIQGINQPQLPSQKELPNGQAILQELIDSHHYGEGLAFLAYGTPTNNTSSSRSGYSDTSEYYEGSYDIEVSDPADGAGSGETNAGCLEWAFGLDNEVAVFKHIAGANDTADPHTKKMHEFFWPQFIKAKPLARLLASQKDWLKEHFLAHVSGRGPLPTIRVGNQPYAILPVAKVKGWQPPDSETDQSKKNLRTLHAILSKLHSQWLQVANDHDCVPHILGQGNPDEELQQILGMEPVSTSGRVRSLIDEQVIAIVAKEELYDKATNDQDRQNIRAFIKNLTESWVKIKEERAGQWPEYADQLTASGLVDLYSWQSEQDLPEFLAGKFRELKEVRDDFSGQHPSVDSDQLLHETLDLFTHRLDAWITSLAVRELETMRRQFREGIYLGAYGWVENLHPGDAAKSCGYIHTPSYDQAMPAAVLHNAYLTHEEYLYRYANSNDRTNPYRLNLNSERVRRALVIINGVRQGQPLDALLGYQFERALHERKLDKYIDKFRQAFPLVGDVGNNGSGAETAARNVVDGLTLSTWWGGVGLKPADRNKAVQEKTGTNNDQATLQQELDYLYNSMDAVHDLLLYEVTYQAVHGHHERSVKALDAVAGKKDPPALDSSISTKLSGRMASQSVTLLLPETDAAANGPRAAAEPRLAGWFSNLIGDLGEIGCRCRFRDANGVEQNITVSLADLVGPDSNKPRFGPADLLYLSALSPEGESTEIQQRVAYHVRERRHDLAADAPVLVDLSRPDGFTYGVSDALALRQQILRTCSAGNYLQPAHLTLPSQDGLVSYLPADVQNIRGRVNDAAARLEALLTQISGFTNQTSANEKIVALFAASRYGLRQAIPAGPTDPNLDLHLAVARDELTGHYEQCDQKQHEAHKESDSGKKIGLFVEAMKALFGDDFVVLPTFTLNRNELSQLPKAFVQTNLLCGRDQERVRLWLQQAAYVHPPLDAVEQSLTMLEAWRSDLPLTLRVAQLPYAAENRWVGLDNEERGSDYDYDRDRGSLSIVAAFGGRASDLVLEQGKEIKLAGILLEQWYDFLPENTVVTGLAFQYDAPSSQAPQCLLLALPGQPSDQWKEADLAQIVKDTFDLAKARAVDLDALSATSDVAPAIGSILPALFFPDQIGFNAVKPSIAAWVKEQVK